MKKYLGLLAGVVLMLSGQKVLAADFIKPSGQDQNVIVSATQSYRNLYTAGAAVTINGNIAGDLTAAGGTVTVVGGVEKSALLAGGTLNLVGDFGSNVKLIGGNVTVTGKVGGDLAIAGGNISVTGKSEIAGDAIIAGGNVIIDAPVNGSIHVLGGNVTINGKVRGGVYVQAGQQLTFGPQAEVGGKITYKGPKQAVVQAGAKIGQIDFSLSQPRRYENRFFAVLTFAFLLKLLALMVAGWLLLKIKRSWAQAVVDRTMQKPWESLGWGFLGVIAVPILIVVCLLAFVGFYVSAIAGAWFVLTLLLTQIFATVVLGFWVLKLVGKTGHLLADWQSLVVGVILWGILGLVPVLGWIAETLLFLMTLGALLQIGRENLKN